MKIRLLHPWQVSQAEALALQQQLAAKVIRTNGFTSEPKLVAGVDLSPVDAHGVAQSAVVVLIYPALTVHEVAVAKEKVEFPYIPGLLSFRESPVMLAALEKLQRTPDLLIVDGQGLAHPRRFGIACHLGLLTDLPTIGCAKSILRGSHGTLAQEARSTAPLVDKNGEVIGAAVRTKTGAAPVYVSIGHKIDLPTAVQWVLACCKAGERLPEPTRLAHLAAADRLPAHATGGGPQTATSPTVESPTPSQLQLL